jgi:hypothetical protein
MTNMSLPCPEWINKYVVNLDAGNVHRLAKHSAALNSSNLLVKQSRYRPRVFQEVKVPRLQDNGTGWW